MLGSEVIAASPIPPGGLDRLRESGPLDLETERGRLTVNIRSAGEPIRLQGELVGDREARLIEVSGRLTEGDRTIGLDCSGVLHARGEPGIAAGEPAAAMGLRRELTVILADGGLLCAATAAPEGSVRPDREEAVAAISHPGGYIEFPEILLSTEYDADGRQHRATLELWPDTDQIAPLHGAGTAVSGCTAKTATGRISTALFQWSLDGHRGQGRYEIIRPLTDMGKREH